MADDGDADERPAVVLDAEGERLRLQAEKAKFRQAIAAANRATSASLVDLPDVQDGPTGTVTVGAQAGALGPWLAHQTLDAAAGTVAVQVAKELESLGDRARVLLVDDRAVLGGATTARLVRDRLVRLTERLTGLPHLLADARALLLDPSNRPLDGGAGDCRDKPDDGAQATAPSPGSALGAALDLLSLARTDYTLTAAAVSTSPSEVVALTAAHLAGGAVRVEVDRFAGTGDSPSLRAADEAARARDAALAELARLEALLRPLENQLVRQRALVTSLEDRWASWATAKDANPTGGPALRQRIEDLDAQVTGLAATVDPARRLADHAAGVLGEVDAALSALTQAAGGADSPLATAVRWERLRPAEQPAEESDRLVDHVLYVGTDQLAADVVTRRSLLGTSGRVSFLGAAAVSWLLLDVAAGVVTAGGAQAKGARLRFDLESGGSDRSELVNGAITGEDPLRVLERRVTWAVLLVAALLVLFTAAAAGQLLFG